MQQNQDVAEQVKQAFAADPYFQKMEVLKAAGQLAPETLHLYEQEKEAAFEALTRPFRALSRGVGAVADSPMKGQMGLGERLSTALKATRQSMGVLKKEDAASAAAAQTMKQTRQQAVLDAHAKQDGSGSAATFTPPSMMDKARHFFGKPLDANDPKGFTRGHAAMALGGLGALGAGTGAVAHHLIAGGQPSPDT
jgi:hypothetical protein